jgi:TonB family protein
MRWLFFGNLLAHASQSALLAVGAAAIAWLVRRLHPQLRLVLWQTVLLATAVLPFVQPWTPVRADLVLFQSVISTGDTASASGRPAGAFPELVVWALGFVLVVGIVARLGWIGAGLWQLHRLVQRATPVRDLPDAARKAMLESGTEAVFLQSDLQGPVSFGLRQGVVLLPWNFSTLDGSAQHFVVLHELLHVRRRDALQGLVEELFVAVFWFYPWTWWIRTRIRLAREQVVDRATARSAAVRAAYVQTLLHFAGHPARTLPMTAGLWRGRELRARIDALYKEVTMSRSRLILVAAIAAVALASLTAMGAAAFPLRTAPLPALPEPARLRTVTGFAVPLPPPAAATKLAQEEDVVRIGGDVKPPVKTKHVNPVYPEEAKEAGIEGVVILEAVINKEGKVAQAKVIRSVPELDQAALDAVLQWEFEPTHIKGKAVSVRMTVTINFTLA